MDDYVGKSGGAVASHMGQFPFRNAHTKNGGGGLNVNQRVLPISRPLSASRFARGTPNSYVWFSISSYYLVFA